MLCELCYEVNGILTHNNAVVKFVIKLSVRVY